MSVRTDLAKELTEQNPNVKGVSTNSIKNDGYEKTVIEINEAAASKTLGRPMGRYITFESQITFDAGIPDNMCEDLSREISAMLPQNGTVLVVGLGNINATPDALGPKTALSIFATRHISKALAQNLNLENLRSVAAITPGVLGQTGIETLESVQSAVQKVEPSAVLAVDSLAAQKLWRLGKTVQLCDSGILPGSGVNNHRSEISRNTLGVKVISLGIPTVADFCGITGGQDKSAQGMIITSPGIDTVISRGAQGLAKAVNIALQPQTDRAILMSLM